MIDKNYFFSTLSQPSPPEKHHSIETWESDPYEVLLSRPSAEALKRLAEALGVTTDYLIEGETDDVARARLEDRELLYLFKEIEKLPDDDKSVVKKFLDAFLTKKKVQELAR